MKDIWCNHEEFNTWKAIHLPNPKSTHIFFLVWINSLLFSKSKAKQSLNQLMQNYEATEWEREWGEVVVCWCFDLFQVRLGGPTILRLMNRRGMEKSGKMLAVVKFLFLFWGSWNFQLEFQIKSNVHRNLSRATVKLFGFSSSIDQLWKFSWIP